MKGVVYRLHDEHDADPLADARIHDLERDVTLFKDLGLNLLFVGMYRLCCHSVNTEQTTLAILTIVDHIDPSCNHNQSMKLLADAGIYVLIVSTFHALLSIQNCGTLVF